MHSGPPAKTDIRSTVCNLPDAKDIIDDVSRKLLVFPTKQYATPGDIRHVLSSSSSKQPTKHVHSPQKNTSQQHDIGLDNTHYHCINVHKHIHYNISNIQASNKASLVLIGEQMVALLDLTFVSYPKLHHHTLLM